MAERVCIHCQNKDRYPCMQEIRGMAYLAKLRLERLRHAWPENRTHEQVETIIEAIRVRALMVRLEAGEVGPFERPVLQRLVKRGWPR